MRADTLKRLGHATWGAGWAFELALALGRHPVTVRRWSAGISEMGLVDHHAVLKVAMHYSKERHAVVKRMVLTIRNPQERVRVYKPRLKRDRKKRPESPLSRYRKLAQGLATKKLSAVQP
jgi:hypothetical protein